MPWLQFCAFTILLTLTLQTSFFMADNMLCLSLLNAVYKFRDNCADVVKSCPDSHFVASMARCSRRSCQYLHFDTPHETSRNKRPFFWRCLILCLIRKPYKMHCDAWVLTHSQGYQHIFWSCRNYTTSHMWKCAKYEVGLLCIGWGKVTRDETNGSTSWNLSRNAIIPDMILDEGARMTCCDGSRHL